MRWIVAGLLLSACHQPTPARPVRTPEVGAVADAALGASLQVMPSNPALDAGPAPAIKAAPAAVSEAVPLIPPVTTVMTHAGAQRTLEIKTAGLELWASSPVRKIKTLLDAAPRDVSFSPAGDMVAAAVCTNAGTMDCTITFFSAVDGSVVRKLLVPLLDNAQFSATGRYFLYSNQYGLYVINTATGALAAHRENGDATSVSAFGGLEDGIEGNASAGWPGVVRVVEDRLVRSSQGLVELTDLTTGKVQTRQLYKSVGPFAHLLLEQQNTMLTFDAANKVLFVWRYPSVGKPVPRRAVSAKKISLRNVLTEICNDCQLSADSGGARILLESSDEDFAILVDLTTGKATRTEVMNLTK